MGAAVVISPRSLASRNYTVPELSFDVACVILRLAVLVTIPACDGQMDRRTYDDSIYRASIASRGKNAIGARPK